MTRPRSSLVSVADTPYYHYIGRCVRRAFLCGEDALTGKSFTHRRQWLLERLKLLTEVFALDLCAYALMSNHYHLVVRLAPERVDTWSDNEVIDRWTRLFSGLELVHGYRAGQTLDTTEQETVTSLLALWRTRLGDLSWFMRCLNEAIARQANAEDGCTGRFWERQGLRDIHRSRNQWMSRMATRRMATRMETPSRCPAVFRIPVVQSLSPIVFLDSC